MLARSAPAALLAVATLSACAASLSPAQQMTWDAYKACQAEGPSTRLDRVQPDGTWYVEGREGEVFKVNDCMMRYREKAQVASRITLTPGSPLTESKAKELVRFAYLTNEAPQPGTPLRLDSPGKMPPKRTEFIGGTPVTFFFALENVNSLFDGQIVWLDPKGVRVRRATWSQEQSGAGGSGVWWTDTLPVSTGLEPGTWTVELLVNNVVAGRYPFTVTPPK